jgi:hypothetical protein
MGLHVGLLAIVYVVRICLDLRMMSDVIPPFQQVSIFILPMEAVFRDEHLPFAEVKPFEHLQQAVIPQC